MEISRDGAVVKAVGHVTQSDYQNFCTTVSDAVKDGSGSTQIELVNSSTISSTAIGFLLKLIYFNGAKLSLLVHDETLYRLLDAMSLAEVLKVKKI